MDIKKIVILPAAFILVHVMYIGCCKCLEGNFYKDVSGLRVGEFGDLTNTNIDTVRVADTLFADVGLLYNLVATVEKNPMAPFVSSATALSCNCGPYGDLGFKRPLDSFTITSNNTYKSIAAGQDLADQFSARFFSYDSLGNSYQSVIAISQLIDSLNKDKRNSGIFLFSKPGAPVEKSHRFTYNLFSNGQKFSANGRLVMWD